MLIADLGLIRSSLRDQKDRFPDEDYKVQNSNDAVKRKEKKLNNLISRYL